MTHRCAHCTRPMPDDCTTRNCDLCIAKGVARSMTTYRRRRDSGKCVRCGGDIEAERAGKATCDDCKNASYVPGDADAMQRRRARQNRRRRINRAKRAILRMREANAEGERK